jgi:hypothetical protein
MDNKISTGNDSQPGEAGTKLRIDPPEAERFVVSLSHRGVGLMPYGSEAEAKAYNPCEPEAALWPFYKSMQQNAQQ